MWHDVLHCLSFSADGAVLAVPAIPTRTSERAVFLYDSKSLELVFPCLYHDLTGYDEVHAIKPVCGGWLLVGRTFTTGTFKYLQEASGHCQQVDFHGYDGYYGMVANSRDCAIISGLGLFIRAFDNTIQVVASTNVAAMVRMSKLRVGWMSAVLRITTFLMYM